MARKPRLKPKPRPKDVNCTQLEGERFHTGADDLFRYNWWEVFCFPYILCARFWDCCVSLCSGTNQCLIYWMLIQWLVCKITHLTTPDPIIFPYYFYMFCQVILLTSFFVLIWVWIGRSVIVPYFVAYYEAFIGVESKPYSPKSNRLRFRKYCFKKGEIFDNTADLTPSGAENIPLTSREIRILTFIVDVIIYKVFD